MLNLWPQTELKWTEDVSWGCAPFAAPSDCTGFPASRCSSHWRQRSRPRSQRSRSQWPAPKVVGRKSPNLGRRERESFSFYSFFDSTSDGLQPERISMIRLGGFRWTFGDVLELLPSTSFFRQTVFRHLATRCHDLCWTQELLAIPTLQYLGCVRFVRDLADVLCIRFSSVNGTMSPFGFSLIFPLLYCQISVWSESQTMTCLRVCRSTHTKFGRTTAQEKGFWDEKIGLKLLIQWQMVKLKGLKFQLLGYSPLQFISLQAK